MEHIIGEQCHRGICYLSVASSYNHGALSSVVFETPHNQIKTITEQLNLGARYLEIDPHSIQLRRDDPGPVTTLVCHTDASAAAIIKKDCQNQWNRCGVLGIRDYGDDTGCNPAADTLQTSLQEVADWLKSNPNEILVILLLIQNKSLFAKIDHLSRRRNLCRSRSSSARNVWGESNISSRCIYWNVAHSSLVDLIWIFNYCYSELCLISCFCQIP
jgi:hypothetical protein